VKTFDGGIAQCVDIIASKYEEEGIRFGSTNMQNMLINYDYVNGKLQFMHHSCDCILQSTENCVAGEMLKQKSSKQSFVKTLPKQIVRWIVSAVVIVFVIFICFICWWRRRSSYSRIQTAMSADETTLSSYALNGSDGASISTDELNELIQLTGDVRDS